MSDVGHESDEIELAARYAAATGPLAASDLELDEALRTHPDPRVRSVALGALVRRASIRRARAAWQHATSDPSPAIRRRATEVAPQIDPPPVVGLLHLLTDVDPLVAESAAWALGEIDWSGRTRARVVAALAEAARAHPDPLVRESAVAALGAIGDARGLPAILAACSDRPPIRRRAVLALAPFAGPEVDAALARALTDSDWQVRQAAEDLAD
jgi:HEAT repeat protein